MVSLQADEHEATTCGNAPESMNTLAIAASRAVARAGDLVTEWSERGGQYTVQARERRQAGPRAK